MAINTRPSLINDGGSTRKKKNQYTTGGKTSGSGAGRGSSSGNKNSSSKKKATTEDLIAAIKKGAQTVSNIGGSMSPNTAVASGAKVLSQTAKSLPTWQSLTTKRNIYPQQPTAKFITTASDVNDYYQKLQISSKAVKDLENDLNEKKRQLSQLSVGIGAAAGSLGKITPDYLNYQEKVKEYNHQLQNYQRAVDEANKNAKDYQNALMEFSGDSSEMNSAVRSDYETLKKANDKARSQAYVDTKNQLESQKLELQKRIEELSKSTKSQIDKGSSLANGSLSELDQLNNQLQDLEANLFTLKNKANAEKTQNVAKSDPKYQEYIEKGKSKIEEYYKATAWGNVDTTWYNQYKNMTPEQQATYEYLMGKETGTEKADEYLKSISAEVNATISKNMQDMAESYAKENPALAGIASIFTTPYTSAQVLGEAIAGLGNPTGYVDPNSRGQQLTRATQAYRQAGLDTIDNPLVKAIAEAGYGVADMAPALAANAVLPGLGTAYMGVLGGTSGYSDAISRGLSQREALIYGATSGAVSTALEKIGLDKIGSAFAGGKTTGTQIIKNVIGSFLSEGSEEAAENIAQSIYDDLIAGEKSNVNLAIKQYMAKGMSEQEAKKQAWKDVGIDTLNSFIVGGLSGGALAGAGSTANAVVNGKPNIAYNALTELGLSEDAAKSLVDAQRPEVVNSLQQSAKQFNVPEEVSSRIETLSNDTNTKVVFDGSLKDGESGFYNPSTQEIHLNPNINNTTIIFSHELTHSLENTSAYNKLSELVLSQIQDIDKVRQDKISLYKEHGIELDSAGVDAEVVAEYVSNKLFSDQEAIQRVANYDLSLAGRIKNWISRMAAKVTGKKDKEFLLKAESLYAKAIQEAKTITDMRTANSLARSFKVDGNLEENMQNALNQVNYKESTAVQYAVSDSRLQKENEELKRQLKRTDVIKPNENRVKAAANQILNGYGSRYDKAQLQAQLDDLYTYIANGKKQVNGKTVELDFDEVMSDARRIAKQVLNESVSVSTNVDMENVKEYLKQNKIYVPANVKKDLTTSFAEFSKDHRKEMKFTNDSDSGVSIEDAWAELSEMYPNVFSDRYINPADQLERIGEVVSGLRDQEYNPFTTGEVDYNTELNRLANDIVERFYSIPQKAPTFADKQARKLTQEKIRSRKKLDALKEKNKQTVSKIQEKNRVKRIELKKAGSEAVKKAKAEGVQKKNEAVKELKLKQRKKEADVRISRENRATRDKITRHVKALSEKLLKPSDKSHIPDELTAPVAKLLESINMESKFTTLIDSEGRLRRATSSEGNPTKRTQAFRELKEAYSKIAKDPRWSSRIVIDPDLEANIDSIISLKDVKLLDMNHQQLETVWNTVRAIEHSVSTINQIFADNRYKSVSELAEAVRSGLDSQKTKTEYRGARGAVDRLVNVDTLNPWDYFHEWGNGGEAIYQSFRSAQDQQIRDIQAMQDFMAGIDNKKIREWMNDKAEEFVLSEGRIKLNTSQKMSLYLLMKREQGKKHILAGGIKQGETKGKRGSIEKSSKPVKVNENDIKIILNSLTAEQKKVADSIGKYMSTTMSEWGNETSMKLYGYQKFTEENYFPIRVDSNYTSREISQQTGQGSIKNKGFTKELSDTATNPVIINDMFSEFARHGVEMAAYHSYLPALEDAQRVYNYKPMDVGYQGSVSEAIERVLGTKGKGYFTNFIQDINGRANLRNDFDVGALLSNYKRAAVGANLRVIIQQPTAYLRALAVLDSKYLAKAVFTPKKWNTVKKYSPIAQWKDWGYFEINTGRQLEDVILGTDSAFEKVQQGLMAGAGKADEITWTRLWSACEYWVKDHHKNLIPETPEFYAEVNRKFGELVDRTQVVDSVLHRSQIMRSTAGINKIATSFMGEPTKTYNLIRTSFRDYVNAPKNQKAEYRKKLAKAMTAFVLSGTLNAAAASLVDALRDDDDDETYLEKWSQAFTGLQGDEEDAGDILMSLLTGGVADNLLVANMIPYVKDIFSIVQGYDVERMDMSSVSDFISAAQKFLRSLNGEGNSSLLKTSADLVMQFARIMGVPISNIARDVGAVTQTVIGAIDDPVITYYYDQLSSPFEKNKGQYYDILYEALEAGNVDAYERIRDDILNKGVSLSDIRSAMRDRFKSAWEKDLSIEENTKLMKEAGVSENTISDWKINDFKAKWKEDPSIAEDSEAMEKAGVTSENIKAWEEEEWKETGYLEELNAMGVDTSTVEQLVNEIKNYSKSADKRRVIRESNLSNEEKAVLYRFIASEKDRNLIDQYKESGKDVGELYRLLDEMANYSKTKDKLNALANSTLSTEDLVELMNAKIFQDGSKRPETLNKMIQTGLNVNDFIKVYSKWSELDEADMKSSEAQSEFSKWLDQQGFDEQQQIIMKDGFKFYSMVPAADTKYDRFTDAGLANDVASSIEEMLSELTPEEGKDSVSSTQQAVAISQGDYSDEDKLKALSVILQDSTYAKVESAYSVGISPSTYIEYWANEKNISADKDENGKSVSGSAKLKTMTYINSLDLTAEQKDYLYREAGWAESKLSEAPWYGGESYEGVLFDEEESGVDGENVWSAASEVVEDQATKITQAYGGEHGGTDIGWSISPTEPIYAAADGTVVWVQTGYGNAPGSSGNASYGNLVEIQHADGTYTLYAHLSNVDVKEGDTIKGGEQLGNMGDSGNAYGSHLHFEYRDANNNRLDSTALLKGDAQPSSGGTDNGESYGGSSSGSSSKGSSKGSSTKKSSKLSPITLSTSRGSVSTSRTVPTAQRLSIGGAIKLSLPTVQKVTKSAVTGSSSGVKTSSLGITSRNSRSSSAKGFIKL